MSPPTRVVWIEIELFNDGKLEKATSPPTRVVWIEILIELCKIKQMICHHPHGWCGLKFAKGYVVKVVPRSPPTRVVWIEITQENSVEAEDTVTTHTGGVD